MAVEAQGHTSRLTSKSSSITGRGGRMLLDTMALEIVCACEMVQRISTEQVFTIGNMYHIYKQDIPEIDMYTHLLCWLDIYEAILGRKLKDEDKLFPHISVNGIIHPDREMSYDSFAKLLARFTDGAGLEGWYTTHSFRRGGAQYRFMFAPPGSRWPLNIVRWWGGWAEGESVGLQLSMIEEAAKSS
jgi:hypothetical protein